MSPRIGLSPIIRFVFLLLALFALFPWSMRTASQQPLLVPAIEFTEVPKADQGGQETLSTISGRVIGGTGEQHIVLLLPRDRAWREGDRMELGFPPYMVSVWPA